MLIFYLSSFCYFSDNTKLLCMFIIAEHDLSFQVASMPVDMFDFNGDLTMLLFNTLGPRQNGCHFEDYTFKCIFLKENVRIAIKISLKVVRKGPIDNIPAWFQIMAWRRSGDKPLSEAMMVNLLTHICVARPQWVKHDVILCTILCWINCLWFFHMWWCIKVILISKIPMFWNLGTIWDATSCIFCMIFTCHIPVSGAWFTYSFIVSGRHQSS